jgi:hypothetical protein
MRVETLPATHEVNDLHHVAITQLSCRMLRTRHDFPVALDRNRALSKPQPSDQLEHRQRVFGLEWFAIDSQLHAASLSRSPRPVKPLRASSAAVIAHVWSPISPP